MKCFLVLPIVHHSPPWPIYPGSLSLDCSVCPRSPSPNRVVSEVGLARKIPSGYCSCRNPRLRGRPGENSRRDLLVNPPRVDRSPNSLVLPTHLGILERKRTFCSRPSTQTRLKLWWPAAPGTTANYWRASSSSQRLYVWPCAVEITQTNCDNPGNGGLMTFDNDFLVKGETLVTC